jgi:AcrR family transcriptional regulator
MLKPARAIAKPARRSHEERRIEMRERILEATISCLYNVGYSRVTIAMVAEAAGVSRGIIGYHYDTKTDLMVAVREEIQKQEGKKLNDAQANLGTLEFLRQFPRIQSAAMRHAGGIAVDEILLASRGDVELRQKLKDLEQAVTSEGIKHAEAWFREIGHEPPKELLAMILVVIAAARGLAISEVVEGDDARIEDGIELLVRFFERIIPPACLAPSTSSAE